MHRPRGWALAAVGIAAACVTVATTGTAADVRNRLSNPGFEEGRAGWNLDPRHTLVTNPAAAASGRICLMGETSEPRQAVRLVQVVEVHSNRVYQFKVRARHPGSVLDSLRADARRWRAAAHRGLGFDHSALERLRGSSDQAGRQRHDDARAHFTLVVRG